MNMASQTASVVLVPEVTPDTNYNEEEKILHEQVPKDIQSESSSVPQNGNEGAFKKEVDVGEIYFRHILRSVLQSCELLSDLFESARRFYEEVWDSKEDAGCPWTPFTHEAFNGLGGDFLLFDVMCDLEDLAEYEKNGLVKDTAYAIVELRQGIDINVNAKELCNGKIKASFLDKTTFAKYEKDLEVNNLDGLNDLEFRLCVLQNVLQVMLKECSRMLDYYSTKKLHAQDELNEKEVTKEEIAEQEETEDKKDSEEVENKMVPKIRSEEDKEDTKNEG